MTETSSQKALERESLESANERTLKWAETLHHAQTRSQMFIGDPETAHRQVFSSLFRFVWQAKVFRQPGRVRIDLSPHQCVFRADVGPLIRPVQEMYSFPGGRVLGETWAEENRAYFERLNAEDEARGLTWSQQRSRRGWRYCFSGPIGPRLYHLTFTALLAHRFVWGLRINEGLWCQAYERGWPVGQPFLVCDPSPVGLIVIADLDPQWFTGLPYDAEDVAQLQTASHKKAGLNQRWKPQPAWSTGEIMVNRHEQDTLVSEWSLSPEGVRAWL